MYDDVNQCEIFSEFVQTPLRRLAKDMKTAAANLSDREARYLVDLYYQLQDARIRAQAQIRAMRQGADDSPGADSTLSFFFDQFATLESQIKNALGSYAQARVAGKWAMSICGIGPVISAGLLANIDIEKAPHVGHVWSFAGLANKTWDKGQKRPWNAQLKTLCAFKIGESFVKQQSRDTDIYGHLFAEKKAQYMALNDAGRFGADAARILTEKKFGKETEAFKQLSAGRLPLAQIHARARRWAVKLFLSHFHQVLFESTYNRPAPRPYIIDIGGHADYISAPHWKAVGAD